MYWTDAWLSMRTGPHQASVRLTITCWGALKTSFKAAKHHIRLCRVESSGADPRLAVRGARSGR